MAAGGIALQRADHFVAVEIARDMAHRAVGVELAAIEAGDARCLLATVLQRVQSQRNGGRSPVHAGNAENTALFAQLVPICIGEVERIGCQHGALRGSKRRPPYRHAIRVCRVFVTSIGSNLPHRRFFVVQEVLIMAKDHGPTVKNDKLYEDLRRDGASKEKAARIANAKAAGTLDHRSTHLEDRSKADLEKEARAIGIEGRSTMDKGALVKAIRKG
jgi:hypothetical protein